MSCFPFDYPICFLNASTLEGSNDPPQFECFFSSADISGPPSNRTLNFLSPFNTDGNFSCCFGTQTQEFWTEHRGSRQRVFARSSSRGSKPQVWRKQGRHGDGHQRLKRKGHRRIPLPKFILANAQSLCNTTDILQANVNFLREYKRACLIALTETWLKQHELQSDLEINGFGELLRLDRDLTVTGKSLCGGPCFQ